MDVKKNIESKQSRVFESGKELAGGGKANRNMLPANLHAVAVSRFSQGEPAETFAVFCTDVESFLKMPEYLRPAHEV